ncbi:MAG: hypothetical protein E6Q06_03655 [Candidatus Moraniibacteriota bacterium]|nr:MAG: hypothetical protein E6Q06_03655 [Candidatus Moranbacteria bacterium]
MVRRTHPKEGGMETPPDPDAIARAFMEAELAKDRPKTIASTETHPEPASSASSQAEVDAYLSSLDVQVAEGNLLTPFTRRNPRRAEELSQPFTLPETAVEGAPVASPAPMAAEKSPVEPKPSDTTSPESESFVFTLPRLGQGKSIRYQAVDGSVYEITKKPGGYRIAKSSDGFAAIASISRTEIMRRGQSEGWQLVQEEASPESAPAVAPTAPESVVPKTPESVAELGLSVGEVWSASEDGHDVDIEILEFFDGSAKEGNARMARIRRTVAGPRRNENYRMETPLYKLAEQLKSYTKKREAPKLRERQDPPLEAPSVEAGAESVPAAESNPGAPTGETVRVPEADAPVVPPANAETVASDLDQKIAKLREEVASERAAFIAVEESQRSAWKNLTRIFRGLSHKDSDDAELMKYRAFYDEKVIALQEAELERLKRSGKTVKELRPEMAALIREFEFDEADRIYDARQAMRLAKTNQPMLEKMKALWADANEGINGPTAKGEVKAWIKLFAGAAGTVGTSALQGIEKGGAAYNKLMRGKYGKLILAASVSTAAVGIATGGIGTTAVGLLALKRLAAGAGVAVTIEDVSERVARARREKRRANVENEHQVRFDAMESEEDLEVALGNKAEISFAKLEKYLKEVAAKTRAGEGARRRGNLYRKSGAIFAGAVLGSGAAAHFANEYIGGVSRAHAAPIPDADTVVSGGPGAGPSLESPSANTAGSAVPESLRDTRAIPMPAESASGIGGSEGVKSFLGAHEVKRGESVWKLAERAIQDAPDVDKRVSGRFAKLVELRLQEKLDANPDLARAAGFVADADGKFSPHQIQKGASLELGKLFSADEIAKLFEEAKADAPIEAPSVPVPDTPVREIVSPLPSPDASSVAESEAERIAREEARIAERIPPISPDERAAIVATFPESPTTELIKPDGNVMRYVETLPREEQEKLFRNFKRISTALFQTNEVMGGETYDMRYDPTIHPGLTKTKLATVLADHKLLGKNPFTTYGRIANPLHGSQMQEVANFSKAVTKAFGESVARPKAAESVQEYVLRMVAIARNQGVNIPGVRMVD